MRALVVFVPLVNLKKPTIVQYTGELGMPYRPGLPGQSRLVLSCRINVAAGEVDTEPN